MFRQTIQSQIRLGQTITSSITAARRAMSSTSAEKIKLIRDSLGSGRYSACDICDALMKLKVPQAGFLPDITPIPFPRPAQSRPLIAPISTILFIRKSDSPPSDHPTSNIPSDKHFTDMPSPDTIAFLQQPSGAISAVLGDIMASRLQIRGVRGVVANGRVRDLHPIGQMCAKESAEGENGMQFSVWSKGSSTVGTGLESKPWCADVPLQIGGVEVKPGDLAFLDERERGVVVIPAEKVDEVLEMMPGIKDADDRCVADVLAGVDVTEVFRRHR